MGMLNFRDECPLNRGKINHYQLDISYNYKFVIHLIIALTSLVLFTASVLINWKAKRNANIILAQNTVLDWCLKNSIEVQESILPPALLMKSRPEFETIMSKVYYFILSLFDLQKQKIIIETFSKLANSYHFFFIPALNAHKQKLLGE